MQYVQEGHSVILLDFLAYAMFETSISAKTLSIDWKKIVDEAKRHAVIAFLYPIVKKENSIPKEIVAMIKSIAFQSATMSEQQLLAQNELIEILNQNGIKCSVLKGFSVARFYKLPELRMPGDIDILVEEDKIDFVKDILVSRGYRFDADIDFHLCFRKYDCLFEVHRTVSSFPTNSKGELTKKIMSDALQHVENATVLERSFPTLVGTYQIVALLSHMEKHIRTGGIGLRQLCDWAVTVNANRSCIDDEFLELLQQCGLLHFAKILTAMCTMYLGLPVCNWAKDIPQDDVELTMLDILDAGNHSARSEVRNIGSIFVNSRETTFKGSFKKYIEYVKQKMRELSPWARSDIWVILFAIYFPVRKLILGWTGKLNKVKLSDAIIGVSRRERVLRKLKLYE